MGAKPDSDLVSECDMASRCDFLGFANPLDSYAMSSLPPLAAISNLEMVMFGFAVGRGDLRRSMLMRTGEPTCVCTVDGSICGGGTRCSVPSMVARTFSEKVRLMAPPETSPSRSADRGRYV